MPLPPTFDARLADARRIAPGVRELTFERVDGQPMAFAPGQWVSARLPPEEGKDDRRAARSYSIASAPDGTARFQIAVTRVEGGYGSAWLHAVEGGASLPFIGPQGFFTRAAESPSPSLLVATGTGVAPLRSMLRAALDAGSRAPLWLLLGVRHEEDVLYGDELRDLAARHPSLRFEPTLSQPRPEWTGRRGYVQTHVRELWEALIASAGGAEPHVYACGLERMVGSVRDLLRKQMGLRREQVHSERYD